MNFSEIWLNVSPCFTIYIFSCGLVSGILREILSFIVFFVLWADFWGLTVSAGIIRDWPTLIYWLFKLFCFFNSLIDTKCFSAIWLIVSPLFTMYVPSGVEISFLLSTFPSGITNFWPIFRLLLLRLFAVLIDSMDVLNILAIY